MSTPFCAAARQIHFTCVPVFLLAVLAAMFGISTSAFAVDRINPCEGYQSYVAIGGEDSAPAGALKRVCETIGPVIITQPCLVYYSRITDSYFPPDDELKAKLAAECEASMTGGTGLMICDGAVCDPPADAEAPDGPCRDKPCVGDNQVMEPEPSVLEPPPSDTMECGNELECLPPSDDMLSPVDPDEIDKVTAGDRPPSDTLECSTGLECRPEPDDPAPVATDTAAAAATGVDPALDLAFWQAIADSADAALFQAYLDRFPDGTFAPIAKARIATLTASPAQAEPPPAQTVRQAAPPVAAEAPAPRDLFDQAQAIMDAAYQLDVSKWDEAAQRAIPLYTAAGEGGWAPAYVELGALAENGIGMTASLDVSRDYFIAAGRLGYLEGYYRALMVLDQAGNAPDYVEIFLTLYRIEPGMALDSLDAVGQVGPKALQSFLRREGYYAGAIDGAFGAGSRAALAAYASGAAPQANTVSDAYGDDVDASDLQEALAQVGCYLSAIDGKWGQGSRDAMTAFNLWNGSNLPVERPTEAALFAVRGAPGQVCGMD